MPRLPISRRALCGAGLALAAGSARAAAPSPDVTADQDFDELWRTLGERYCYFSEKRTDWNKVRARYRPLAIAAETEADFAEVVRQVLAELYDAHTHLHDPPAGSPRWPLYDLLAERAADGVRLVAVQEGSAAAKAGLAPGDRILAIGETRIEAAVQALLPRCLSRPDPAADTYAINVAVGGLKGQPRRFTVQSKAAPRQVEVPLDEGPRLPDFASRRLDEGFGYLAIRSFGDRATVGAFDQALDALREAPGLVIDVRENGGGDTAVARPIMGRFITEPKAYAQMRRREGAGLGAAWTELVEPRGPFTYSGPVVVLTNHWSASMAEGFPLGMRSIGRARIVGTRMMGLGAAVFTIRLDRTGVQAQYSGEPVFDLKGLPRAALRPDVEVAEGADVLRAGIAELQRLAARP